MKPEKNRTGRDSGRPVILKRKILTSVDVVQCTAAFGGLDASGTAVAGDLGESCLQESEDLVET